MNRIRVECKVNDYPEERSIERTTVTVKSHWNRDELVHVAIGNEEVIVVATDLILALQNCKNAR